MTVNRLRARLAAGEQAVGAWCSSGSPFIAELLAGVGFDYVCVDTQHGLFTGEAELALLGIRGATPVARVASNATAALGRALDAGAEAVIVPLVNSAADAARAAAGARYPPNGVRSFGTNRSRLRGAPADVDAEVQCLVMIETRAAIAAAADICAVHGIDGVYLGPSDLAVGLGLPPGATDDRLEAAIEEVRRACAGAGVAAGIHCTGTADAVRRLDQGFGLVTVATDVVLLRAAAADAVRAARERPPGWAGGAGVAMRPRTGQDADPGA